MPDFRQQPHDDELGGADPEGGGCQGEQGWGQGQGTHSAGDDPSLYRQNGRIVRVRRRRPKVFASFFKKKRLLSFFNVEH
jgi:hypothetical protein